LTGWGQDGDRRRAHVAGFDHHCTKPVDPEEFERFFVPNNES
jgi:CheY-like chemotaxis protein